MAIYWCDPYIESPSGGVHGTTGAGTVGSYSNPYSLDNLPSGSSSGYSAGDEVRLKSLPTNPWITGPAWNYHWSNEGPRNNSSGIYGVNFASAAGPHAFLKYTTEKGDEHYLNWSNSSNTALYAEAKIWESGAPYADATQDAYKLDPQYCLSNLVTPNKSDLLCGKPDVPMTLTAGWVSETARGGETIIHRVSTTAYDEYWFGTSSIQQNKMTVDAPELTISRSSVSGYVRKYIYGETVEIRDVNAKNTYSTSNQVRIYTALTFKANCVASGGYIYLFTPYYDNEATQGVNRDIKHILGGYYLQYYTQGSYPYPQLQLKFKTYNTYINDHSPSARVRFSYYDDFYFNINTRVGSGTPTEMAVISAVNKDTAPAFRKPCSTISPQLSEANNYDYKVNGLPINTYNVYLTGGASVNVRGGDVYFRNLNMHPSSTLENTTTHSVAVNIAANRNNSHSKLWGVDRNSGRRVAFAPVGSTAKEMMLMYNSTEYGGKLVYHLMPHTGTCFDRVYLPMPTGVSEITADQNYRLKFTLGGTTVGSIYARGVLDGNSTNDLWHTPSFNETLIDASSGGAGAVIYSDTRSGGPYLEGAQQLTLILELRQSGALGSHNVAKLCIESIELEVV